MIRTTCVHFSTSPLKINLTYQYIYYSGTCANLSKKLDLIIHVFQATRSTNATRVSRKEIFQMLTAPLKSYKNVGNIGPLKRVVIDQYSASEFFFCLKSDYTV
jgi:hypothetical protein